LKRKRDQNASDRKGKAIFVGKKKVIMVNFRTVVMPEVSGEFRIDHAMPLLLMGSCFAEHIGRKLAGVKFHCDVNPFGVLYNPLSVSSALREIRRGKEYAAEDLFQHRDCWGSLMHHGSFSSPDREEALGQINGRLQAASRIVPALSTLMITWGTAWVYETVGEGRIVGNCHKLPDRCFTRRRLSVEEIVDDYRLLISEWLSVNPRLRLLFTVSPIRHPKDGLHGNQLSKATLLLAVEALQAAFPQSVFYFPAYEIMLDELRDYRFYADDMCHPSNLAVEYLWEKFDETYFSPATRSVMRRCEEIRRGVEHRPFQPQAAEYEAFLNQSLLKIGEIQAEYPYLDFANEEELCHTRLNQLQRY
jgi:hypothetical protein